MRCDNRKNSLPECCFVQNDFCHDFVSLMHCSSPPHGSLPLQASVCMVSACVIISSCFNEEQTMDFSIGNTQGGNVPFGFFSWVRARRSTCQHVMRHGRVLTRNALQEERRQNDLILYQQFANNGRPSFPSGSAQIKHNCSVYQGGSYGFMQILRLTKCGFLQKMSVRVFRPARLR